MAGETPHNRSFSRAFALREKIGGTGGIGDYIGKAERYALAHF
jgi:hypothetical protein